MQLPSKVVRCFGYDKSSLSVVVVRPNNDYYFLKITLFLTWFARCFANKQT